MLRQIAFTVAFVGLGALAQAQPSTLPLLQSSDLVYQYYANFPKVGTTDDDGFAYGGEGLTFNSAHNSLFIVGKESAHKAAEVSISTTSGYVSVLQMPVDVTEGRLNLINPTSTNMKVIGGLLPWNGRLVASGYDTYDGGSTQVLSHFVGEQALATTGDVQGPFQVGVSPLKAGFVSAYMGTVPQAWRAAFGGPAFTGNCCIAIVGRTSLGPSVSVFDPADVGVKNPVPATSLLFYDSLHPLGPYNSASQLYNGTTKMGGVVMPEGTRSVLFLGRQGSKFCYGKGTTIQSLDGQPVPNEPGVIYCYDLEDQSKGTHGYPYHYQVWAYDGNDLVDVKEGRKQPWEPRPYATWALTFPTFSPFTRVMGVAYDGATDRLFVIQYNAARLPSGTDTKMPVLHIFKVNRPATSGPLPVTPINLVIK